MYYVDFELFLYFFCVVGKLIKISNSVFELIIESQIKMGYVNTKS